MSPAPWRHPVPTCWNGVHTRGFLWYGVSRRLALALIVCGLLPAAAGAGELTAKEIITRADDLLRGRSSAGSYRMTVTAPAWQRVYHLKAWVRERAQTFIRVTAPPKDKGFGTLRLGDNMWNYVPTVERTIKIPPSMMLQPWLGSDFSNDDLALESSIVNDYDHRILHVEPMEGSAAYKIELLPHSAAPVTWGTLIYWVRQADFVPLREEFLNERGELIKTLVFSDIRVMHDRTIPTRWTMTSRTRQGRSTVLELLDVQYNVPIDERIFTHEHLKRTDDP